MKKFREIGLTVLFSKESRNFIAYSPALDISTCAATFEKAKKRLEELLVIFFEELEENGTLDEVLDECGWHKVKTKKENKWIPPRFIAQTEETFKIPCQR